MADAGNMVVPEFSYSTPTTVNDSKSVYFYE